MNIAKIEALVKKAEIGREMMEIACWQIAKELQPFFVYELSVDFQPSDGFVVVWEANDGFAPHNIPVMDVVEKISDDPNAFISA